MSAAKPKSPEIAGGRPLPPFPALVGKTWYRGGGRIIVYVPSRERHAFGEACAAAGYYFDYEDMSKRDPKSVLYKFVLSKV